MVENVWKDVPAGELADRQIRMSIIRNGLVHVNELRMMSVHELQRFSSRVHGHQNLLLPIDVGCGERQPLWELHVHISTSSVDEVTGQDDFPQVGHGAHGEYGWRCVVVMRCAGNIGMPESVAKHTTECVASVAPTAL